MFFKYVLFIFRDLFSCDISLIITQHILFVYEGAAE